MQSLNNFDRSFGSNLVSSATSLRLPCSGFNKRTGRNLCGPFFKQWHLKLAVLDQTTRTAMLQNLATAAPMLNLREEMLPRSLLRMMTTLFWISRMGIRARFPQS